MGKLTESDMGWRCFYRKTPQAPDAWESNCESHIRSSVLMNNSCVHWSMRWESILSSHLEKKVSNEKKRSPGCSFRGWNPTYVEEIRIPSLSNQYFMKSKRWHTTHHNQFRHNGIPPRPVSWVLEKDGRRGDLWRLRPWTLSFAKSRMCMNYMYW